MTSVKLARKLVSRFHSLLEEEARVKADTGLSAGAKSSRLAEIERHMSAMGGRRAYQEGCDLSTKQFRNSRYVFKQLAALGRQPVPARGEPPLNVLELGAVNTQLQAVPWLSVWSIDLLSRDPAIEQRDFFSVPVLRDGERDRRGAVVSGGGQFDCVVNFMVINCVPDAVRRAEMLVRCRCVGRWGGGGVQRWCRCACDASGLLLATLPSPPPPHRAGTTCGPAASSSSPSPRAASTPRRSSLVLTGRCCCGSAASILWTSASRPS